MTELFLMVISAVFVNNMLLDMGFGADATMNHSKRMDVAYNVSWALIFLLPTTTSFGYVIEHFLLVPNDLTYARLLIFVVLILFVMAFLKPLFNKLNSQFSEALNIYYPIVGLNTIALASIYLSLQISKNILHAFAYGLASALAVSLVLILFTEIRQRLETSDVPAPFKGVPISLISLGMVSMGFLGFAAVVKT